jgi:segregation and condensation protein A
MIAASHTDYQVVLETFRGPLDLLLYLVKRDEVDIRDIPIARVADQFKHYLDVLSMIDVESAGDFLVMAATLMEIKSKMLLPQPEESAGHEEDPRRELVRQLIQYKRFKEAAGVLEEWAKRQSQRLPRVPVPEPAQKPGLPPLKPVELWDLVSAFGRLLRETMSNQPQAIIVDHTPLQVHMDQVLQRLREAGPLPFSALFLPPYTRSRLVGLFLAILELAKMGRILAQQSTEFGDIQLCLSPTGPMAGESPGEPS